jgi:hypothetical protein
VRVASEAQVRAAELARLEAVVDRHATESEKFSLRLSGIRRHGISLEEFEGRESPRRRTPDPVLLERIARRAERRARFGLPAVVCAGDPPTRFGCSCLEWALDEPDARSKLAVLRRAARFHWAPPARSQRAEPMEDSQDPAPVVQGASGGVLGALPGEVTTSSSEPPRKREPEPEKAHRFYRRSRKWFDPDPDIRNMRF